MMLWILAALALLFIAWLVRGVLHIGRATEGPKIDSRPNTALLLIDLQTVFWESEAYDEETKRRTLENITTLVTEAKAQNNSIIAIRQEWSEPATRLIAKLTMKGQAVAGTPGTEVAKPFNTMFTHEVVKRVQDGFETGELDALLESLNVGKVIIAGLDGEYCVARTAEAALNRGYDVELATNGIMTSRTDKLGAVIEKLTLLGARTVGDSA